MKIIEITVAPDGKATVQTQGFAGGSCRDATRLLEAALGEVTEERLTSEFHQAHASHRQQTKNR